MAQNGLKRQKLILANSWKCKQTAEKVKFCQEWVKMPKIGYVGL